MTYYSFWEKKNHPNCWLVKVWIFWEGNKIWKIFRLKFDVMELHQILGWRSFQILRPSQNIRTLSEILGCPCSYIPVIWISILTCKPNNLRNSNCGTAEYICISSRISLKMWTFVTTCGNALYFLTIDMITKYILKQ